MPAHASISRDCLTCHPEHIPVAIASTFLFVIASEAWQSPYPSEIASADFVSLATTE